MTDSKLRAAAQAILTKCGKVTAPSALIQDIHSALREALAAPEEPCVACADWQREQEILAAERDQLRAEVERLRAALTEAADAIEHWGGYVWEYFAEKYHLADDIAKARAALEEPAQFEHGQAFLAGLLAECRAERDQLRAEVDFLTKDSQLVHQDNAALQVEVERLRADIGRYIPLLRHMHVRGHPENPDECRECGLDLRDPVHVRAALEEKP